MHGGAGRNRIGLAALGLHVGNRVFPALANADVELFIDHLHVRAHHAAEQDIADAVVDGVLVRHPAFLHQAAFHADLGRDGRDHAGMVGLYATDRDQRVGIGSDGIGDDVFELAQLVAAEGEARIAVLALGIEFDLAAEVLRQPLQLLDMGGPECERIALEFLQHRHPR